MVSRRAKGERDKVLDYEQILAILQSADGLADLQTPETVPQAPEVTFLDKELLQINTAYQRVPSETRASQKLIRTIVEEYDPRLFGVIDVVPAERPGRYDVFDGGTRTGAAFLMPALRQLPCMIYANADEATAAELFIKKNTSRVKVVNFTLYHARATLGNRTSATPAERTAAMLARICREADVEIPRTTVPLRSMKPNQAICLRALERMTDEFSPEILVRALKTLRRGYPDLPGQIKEDIIRGLVRLFF